jgi:hypothetical protein
VNAIRTELRALMAFAGRLNHTSGPSRRITAETWLAARDEIARGIARSVGRLSKELGVVGDDRERAFRARQADTGVTVIRGGGRSIPVERRLAQGGYRAAGGAGKPALPVTGSGVMPATRA